ncbi:GNAT family N-acetyltransferase [Streptomyces orinoci]|uniref:Lysine N-acyltransferase MbtK n=1 Tax=Streptomyces orinoci TaxID=67339 RepID=A0ABV3K2G1_STRON|nr:GNAT family N-acetyltransferase [Streptomyces orinoci]
MSADSEDTLDLRLTGEARRFIAGDPPAPRTTDLLDGLPGWGPVATAAGPFHLVPVQEERDLALLARWMNDPAVAAVWGLGGPRTVTAAHLAELRRTDGRSVPCLGVLGGVVMSYWEIYRADLDLIARHYRALPHDTGVRLLIGRTADRGHGLGTLLLRTVADLVLDRRPHCGRVIADPDLRNIPAIAAHLGAGFRLAAELAPSGTQLAPSGRQLALLMRERALRGVLQGR